MMTQKERMIAQLPYLASDPELVEDRKRAKQVWHAFNRLGPDEFAQGQAMLRNLFAETGEGMYIEPTFRCDYGYNIHIGHNFYSNYNLIILDIAPVYIGHNVMIGPNVGIYTAGHPIHPLARQSGYEYGIRIEIGDNVWIGASAVINPGVKIGENTVIASGSIVTKDIPANCLAGGNPCRVIREIKDRDQAYYFKDRKFDLEWE